ncbi:MAG: thrombospondin type 3 repeat-containing protein, partial [Pseudomonadales bacterium]
MMQTLMLCLLAFSVSSLSFAEPPFGGTIFIDPDIITAQDPTTFQSIADAGQGQRSMYDRRVADWVSNNAFLFDATYSDGLTLEVQVNSEFETEALASAEAQKYAEAIGQLPKALRRDVETVWIHKGTEPFGGGNNNLLIHVGQSDLYVAEGILEETLVHEAAHTSIDAEHANSEGWITAQQADNGFISTYAQDYAVREDIAESFLPFLAVTYRSDRISDDLAQKINAAIPNRIDYFKRQAFDLSLLTETSSDTDGDGVNDVEDNCAETANPDQTDSDQDGVGDKCEAGAVTPVAQVVSMVCPCSFEQKDQTFGIAQFSIAFNNGVETSGDLSLEILLMDGFSVYSNPYQVIGDATIKSLSFDAEPQKVEVLIPLKGGYAATSGIPSLKLSLADDSNSLLDQTLLSLKNLDVSRWYGTATNSEVGPLLFLTTPIINTTEGVFSVTVDEMYAPLAKSTEQTLDLRIKVTNAERSYFNKGDATQSVLFDERGIASFTGEITLTNELSAHLESNPNFTNIVLELSQNDELAARYWAGSLGDDAGPDLIGLLTSFDTLIDSDRDGVSDFNEGLMASDPKVSDVLSPAVIEIGFTYGDSAKIGYGDDLNARIIFLLESANLMFETSKAPVSLVELGRVDVGDDRDLSAETLINAMETRAGLFEGMDEQFTRRPDLIIHLGMIDEIGTGGLANLLGQFNDGIIDAQNAYSSGANVGIVGLDNPELTLPHEVGHLMGLAHSRAQGEMDGAFAWSRGFGVTDDFVTIMGYVESFGEAKELSVFSSPDLNCGP